MILVITETLNLSFVLQHQGRFLQYARTATDALRILRDSAGNIQGVILDERLQGSRLVSGYIRTHVPGVQLISWRTAQMHSPFRNVMEGGITTNQPADSLRYVWDKSETIGK